MIQRFVYATLKTGIQEILDDPTILDDIFRENYCLEQSEVDSIKEAFAAKPPNVIHHYARSESEFPLYSVVLESEQEAEHFIGDDAGMIDEPDDPLFGADRIATIFSHDYSILTYTEHPDLTLYYYEIAKSILVVADLKSQGLFNTHISGMDLMPDPRYIPEHLFVRRMSFKADREFQRIDRDSKLGKAFRLGGIHVDSSGSPSGVGGVKTLVMPSGILDEGSE
jgi:hypothetical protein